MLYKFYFNKTFALKIFILSSVNYFYISFNPFGINYFYNKYIFKIFDLFLTSFLYSFTFKRLYDFTLDCNTIHNMIWIVLQSVSRYIYSIFLQITSIER